MNDDYLWDRSGSPDPDVERLERTLGPLRYRHRSDFVQPPVPRTHILRAAAAAAVLVVLGASQFGVYPLPPVTHWQVATLDQTSPSNALVRFKANHWVGLALTLAFLADAYF